LKLSTQGKYSKESKTTDRGNKPSKRFKTLLKPELPITDNPNFFYSVMSSLMEEPDGREFFSYIIRM
jgi:hypothetical protein